MNMQHEHDTTSKQWPCGGATTPVGWWRMSRTTPLAAVFPGTYVVSLGDLPMDATGELWCMTCGAVMDDYGTLRRIKQ